MTIIIITVNHFIKDFFVDKRKFIYSFLILMVIIIRNITYSHVKNVISSLSEIFFWYSKRS